MALHTCTCNLVDWYVTVWVREWNRKWSNGIVNQIIAYKLIKSRWSYSPPIEVWLKYSTDIKGKVFILYVQMLMGMHIWIKIKLNTYLVSRLLLYYVASMQFDLSLLPFLFSFLAYQIRTKARSKNSYVLNNNVTWRCKQYSWENK